MEMRIALGQINTLTDDILAYAVQLGVAGIQVNTPKLPGEKQWEYEDLLALRLKCEAYGLRLESVENVPIHFYDQAMLGLPGREEQIENYQTTIRNVGRRASPCSATTACPTPSGARHRRAWARGAGWHHVRPGRGHARPARTAFLRLRWRSGSAMRRDRIWKDEISSEDEMWANYVYFLQACPSSCGGVRR